MKIETRPEVVIEQESMRLWNADSPFDLNLVGDRHHWGVEILYFGNVIYRKAWMQDFPACNCIRRFAKQLIERGEDFTNELLS